MTKKSYPPDRLKAYRDNILFTWDPKSFQEATDEEDNSQTETFASTYGSSFLEGFRQCHMLYKVRRTSIVRNNGDEKMEIVMPGSTWVIADENQPPSASSVAQIFDALVY